MSHHLLLKEMISLSRALLVGDKDLLRSAAGALLNFFGLPGRELPPLVMDPLDLFQDFLDEIFLVDLIHF